MEKIIPQEEFDKLLDHPGKVRGVALTTAAKFIHEREGEEGVMRMKVTPQIWKRNYNQGRLNAVDYRKKEKTVVLRLHDFSGHPLLCEDLNGYFPSVVQMVIEKGGQGEETKCVHRGDSYHEFLLNW